MEQKEIDQIDTNPIEPPTNELIEAEVDKLLEEEYNIPLNKDEKKNKQKDEIEIEIENLDEIDDIIESNYKGNNKDDKDIIFQDKEINDLINQYDKQVDKEIEEELIKTYKPHFDEEDIKRAEKLLSEDELIKEAVDKKIITKEEVILFIDYYEIFSLINKSKKFTLKELKIIEKLTEKNKKKKDNEEEEDDEDEEDEDEEDESNNSINDEDAIKKLTNEIESKLNVQESILSNRFDYDKLLFHKGDFITQIDSRKKSKNDNNQMSKSQMSFKNKEKEDKKNISKISTNTNKESVISNKSNFTNEELMQVPKYTHNNFHKDIKKNTSSNYFTLRNKNKNPKTQKIELFDDNANPTNLLKVRSNRRELIKLTGKYKGSLNKELFKFNPKMTREDNKRLREQFIQMFDIPKDYIENQKIDPMRKSFLRKKIEAAQNYYKNKK